MQKILITGTAGFIGYHLAGRLLEEGHTVVGIDNINDYYSTDLKYDRLKQHGIEREAVTGDGFIPSAKYDKYEFFKGDLSDRTAVEKLFDERAFDIVINLAAQPGVRYSLRNPHAYIESNINGFLNILEGCRHHGVKHLIYASSSSVYGSNTNMPFSVSDNVDHPVSLYASSKKSNELMAHTYSSLYDITTTGLRFFTVYGPWGRPDMAYYLFTKTILDGRPIDVYNYGKMERDFTYIDDIVECMVRLIPKPPSGDSNWDGADPDPAVSYAPYRLFNIGHNSPVKLMDFIGEIEKQIGVKAEKNMMPIQPGDIPKTWADVTDLFEYIDYKPVIPLEEGIKRFIEWYKAYHKVGQ